MSTSNRNKLTSSIHRIKLPLKQDLGRKWTMFPFFRGSTPNVIDIECHVSILEQGEVPHPPHRHQEEELLILISGEVDLLLPGNESMHGSERQRLKVGEFVYYPANFPHTLQTLSKEHATYLMFKWHSVSPIYKSNSLGYGIYSSLNKQPEAMNDSAFQVQLLFEGPTDNLNRLHCHNSYLAPGGGYDEHFDSHDVAILVLEGEVDTLNERVGPNGVIFYRAGERHGMQNKGSIAARYIVFEFHGNHIRFIDMLNFKLHTLVEKLTDPMRWKRKTACILKRLTGKNCL